MAAMREKASGASSATRSRTGLCRSFGGADPPALHPPASQPRGAELHAASAAPATPQRRLVPKLYVLVGRPWAHPDVGDRVPGDARTDAHKGTQIHDRRIHDPLHRELLNLEKHRLAL